MNCYRRSWSSVVTLLQQWRLSSFPVVAVCVTSLFLSLLVVSAVPPTSAFLCAPKTTTATKYVCTPTSRIFTIRTPTALAAKKKKKKKDANFIAVNRVAYRNYEVLETLEAGISLKGTEVKSIRDGKMNLRDGYIRPTKNGRSCMLYNVHIGKNANTGEYFQHEELRPRPLLVHKEEARKLLQKTEKQQSMTIVPLRAYFNKDNRVKIQIALCRGKNVRDKREAIKERESKRESNRIIKNFRA